jgi:exopolyphosphatase / guanosine-5'-triphosphate,3'-diphosphate pyrophosphatase
VVIGAIDIGTNTTRLLVAEVGEEGLRPLIQRRHFVTPGSEDVESLVELVDREASAARDAGAEHLLVVGTAPLRRLPQARRLGLACERIGVGGLRILSEREEASLAFLGATACEVRELPESVCVVDVGGGSTELIVGRPGREPSWWASRPIGSRNLTERAFLADPPTPDQLAAARNAIVRRLTRIEPPAADLSLTVGGGSTSLRMLTGGTFDRDSIGPLLAATIEGDSVTVGERLGLAPQRVRLLPAALLIFEAICELVPQPLRIAGGGVREGLLIAHARSQAAGEAGRR